VLAIRLRNLAVGAIALTAVLAGCQAGPWQEQPASFYSINQCSAPIQVLGTTSLSDGGTVIPSTELAIPAGERDTARSDFDLAHADGALYLWVAAGDSKKWPSEPTAHIALADMTVDKSNPDWPRYTYEISGDLCPN